MFWSRRPPPCPVSENDRDWIEHNLRWMVATFGQQPVARPPYLTSTPGFPTEWTASCDEAVGLVRIVAGLMNISTHGLEVDFYDDRGPQLPALYRVQSEEPSAAGLYFDEGDVQRVSLAADGLDDPLSLVATIAHELSHTVLIGIGYVDPAVETDHEPLTDLFAIYAGFGWFLSQAALRFEASDAAGVSSWSMRSAGYLTMPHIGYAMAVIGHLGGDRSPRWVREFRADVRQPLKQGLRYLDASGLDTRPYDPDEDRLIGDGLSGDDVL